MNLSPKYTAAIICGTFFIFLWNGLLIIRDNKMFEGYKQRQAQICAQMKSFHPDCQTVQ